MDELDASNAGEFKRDIAPVLQANTKLVLDLSRLRFVDSSGLGAMLSCLRQLSAKSGDLKLCGMSKQVRGLFELVRMHRIFDIYGTQEKRRVHASTLSVQKVEKPATADVISSIQESIRRHARYSLGKTWNDLSARDLFQRCRVVGPGSLGGPDARNRGAVSAERPQAPLLPLH